MITDMIALPARLGGLSVSNRVDATVIAHENSKFISLPLVRIIVLQEAELEPCDLLDEIKLLRYITDRKIEKLNCRLF